MTSTRTPGPTYRTTKRGESPEPVPGKQWLVCGGVGDETTWRLVDNFTTPPQTVKVTIDAYGGGPIADFVNHPPHYTAHPSGVECITITEHMGFNVGNAVKYLWRADEKGNALEDLQKAAWYINREIARRSPK